MKICVQWTKNPSEGWEEYDHTAWNSLPFKDIPKGNEIIDSSEGYIFALNVQGVVFQGDHYLVQQTNDEIIVACWEDDPNDFMPEEMVGHIYTFKEIKEDGPQQTCTAYKNPYMQVFSSLTGKVAHGIWVEQDLFDDHRKFQPDGWEHWIGDKLNA